MNHQLLSIKARTMKTSLRKIIRICAFASITLISIACNPTCEQVDCVPSSEEVTDCHEKNREFSYTTCECLD